MSPTLAQSIISHLELSSSDWFCPHPCANCLIPPRRARGVSQDTGFLLFAFHENTQLVVGERRKSLNWSVRPRETPSLFTAPLSALASFRCAPVSPSSPLSRFRGPFPTSAARTMFRMSQGRVHAVSWLMGTFVHCRVPSLPLGKSPGESKDRVCFSYHLPVCTQGLACTLHVIQT